MTYEKLKHETLEEAACVALGWDYDYWLKFHSKDQSSFVYIEVTAWCKGAKWQKEKMYSEEGRLKRSDKLWKKLVKELSVLNDNNYAARRLFDYIERHYRQPPQQPPITNN